MWKTLFKIPIIFVVVGGGGGGGGSIDLVLQVQIELKSQNLPHFELVCAISHHQLKSVFPHVGKKMHLSTIDVPIDFGVDWPWFSVSFLISNLFILPKFASHYSFASVCIYIVRPSLVSAAHSTWHRTCTDSFMLADSVAPWTVEQFSFISWWDHRSSMSRRLGDWHWILQNLIGSCQIIHTSHAVIFYANIRQSQKQQ